MKFFLIIFLFLFNFSFVKAQNTNITLNSDLSLNCKFEKVILKNPDYNFESFSKYVHGNNIEEISQELESAIIGIQSNGNPNFIFMDLSLKLTRLIQ